MMKMKNSLYNYLTRRAKGISRYRKKCSDGILCKNIFYFEIMLVMYFSHLPLFQRPHSHEK